jgi:hypothetical protein
LTASGDTLSASLVVTDARSGAVTRVEGSGATLLTLADRLGDELTAPLGLSARDPSVPSLPASPEARRAYAVGLVRARARDFRAARALFASAVALEPRFARAQLALTEADAQLGYDSRARKEAAAVVAALPVDARSEEALRIEAAAATAARDWNLALARWQRLSALVPDSPDAAFGIASAAWEAHRTDEARVALGRLRALRPADPRVELLAVQASEDDYAEQLEQATQALAAAERSGVPDLVAKAQLWLSHAREEHMDIDGAVAANRSAAETCRTLGDRACVARADRLLASLLSTRGQPEEARQLLQSALDTFEALDKRDGEIDVIAELAFRARLIGSLDEAKSLADKALAMTQEVGYSRSSTILSVKLAEIAYDQGDLASARARFEQALSKRKTGVKKTFAQTLAHIAEIEWDTGNEQASEHMRKALATMASIHSLLSEMRLRLAEARHQLEAGDSAPALETARSALPAATRAHVREIAVSAATLLLSALPGGDGDGAPEALELLRDEAAHAQSPMARLDAQESLASWSGARSAREGAQSIVTLRSLVQTAHARGQVRRELRCLLTLGELELRWHDPAGRPRLKALAARAAQLGFLRVSRRAAQIAE